MASYSIISLREHPHWKQQMAQWFHEKWGNPQEVYLASMEEALSASAAWPEWYAAVEDGRIIGGMGVIENDFHDRKDLAPNICAVFTEPDCRGRGIAGALLSHVCDDMRRRGVSALYLLTDHDSFYERYGWHFLCMAQGDGEETMSRIYEYRL